MRIRRKKVAWSAKSPRQRALGVLGGIWDVAAYATFALFLIVVASRRFSGTSPSVLQPFQAILPLVLAPAYALTVLCAISRRWLQAGIALVFSVIHWFSIAPALGKDVAPAWVDSAPKVSILASNLFIENQLHDEVAKTIDDANADVVVLVEFTPATQDVITASPSLTKKYPYMEFVGRNTPTGSALLSRFPIDEVLRVTRHQTISGRLTLPDGQKFRVFAIHPMPPLANRALAEEWASDLETFTKYAVRSAEPVILAGDFNGTRWQPTFGKMLAAGLTDVHETVGKGLSTSWPMDRLVPFVRLDRALVKDGFATEVRDFRMPGSDHGAFVATIALKPTAGPSVPASPPETPEVTAEETGSTLPSPSLTAGSIGQ